MSAAETPPTTSPLPWLDDGDVRVYGTKANPGLARTYGFFCVHHLRSKGTQAGVPDWWMLREREIWLELKTAKGKLSEAQRDVFRRMLAAGVEAYVVRPTHLETLGKVLAYRGNPFAPLAWGTAAARPAAELRQATRLECAIDDPPLREETTA